MERGSILCKSHSKSFEKVRTTTVQFLDYFCCCRKLQNVFKNSKKQTLYMFITLAFKETETLLAAKNFYMATHEKLRISIKAETKNSSMCMH